MFPILILLVPLIGALTINYYSKNERIVKYFPLIVSFVVSLIIIIYSIFNNLSHVSSFNQFITLYDIFPSLNVSMSFSITKISISLLFLSNIAIITALFSTLNLKKRVNEINSLILIISVGIYGLIISNDLFVFFLFYEISLTHQN